MTDPKIDLKNAYLAAALAFLMPGAGHLYQRRLFKAVVYFVCILGTFAYGMLLTDGKVVHSRDKPGLWYCQYLVGLPALPAIIQARRYDYSAPELQKSLAEPVSASFKGRLIRGDENRLGPQREVSGTISLKPKPGSNGYEVEGTFQGEDDQGAAVELQLGNDFEVGKEIYADPRRVLRCDVVEQIDSHWVTVGRIDGSFPRPIKNWFEVPLSVRMQKEVQGRLGKFYELAEVFTWIAGLLNILAIWDALDGPAYGYGQRRDRKKRHGTDVPEQAGSTSGNNQQPKESGEKQAAGGQSSKQAREAAPALSPTSTTREK